MQLTIIFTIRAIKIILEALLTIFTPIMLALFSMLSIANYAHNYAGIIGGSLLISLCMNFKNDC